MSLKSILVLSINRTHIKLFLLKESLNHSQLVLLVLNLAKSKEQRSLLRLLSLLVDIYLILAILKQQVPHKGMMIPCHCVVQTVLPLLVHKIQIENRSALVFCIYLRYLIFISKVCPEELEHVYASILADLSCKIIVVMTFESRHKLSIVSLRSQLMLCE